MCGSNGRAFIALYFDVSENSTLDLTPSRHRPFDPRTKMRSFPSNWWLVEHRRRKGYPGSWFHRGSGKTFAQFAAGGEEIKVMARATGTPKNTVKEHIESDAPPRERPRAAREPITARFQAQVES